MDKLYDIVKERNTVLKPQNRKTARKQNAFFFFFNRKENDLKPQEKQMRFLMRFST